MDKSRCNINDIVDLDDEKYERFMNKMKNSLREMDQEQ